MRLGFAVHIRKTCEGKLVSWQWEKSQLPIFAGLAMFKKKLHKNSTRGTEGEQEHLHPQWLNCQWASPRENSNIILRKSKHNLRFYHFIPTFLLYQTPSLYHLLLPINPSNIPLNVLHYVIVCISLLFAEFAFPAVGFKLNTHTHRKVCIYADHRFTINVSAYKVACLF